MIRHRLHRTSQFAVAFVLSALAGALCGATAGDDQPELPAGPVAEAPASTRITVTASIVSDLGAWALSGPLYGSQYGPAWGGPDPYGRAAGMPGGAEHFRLIAEGVTVELVPLGQVEAPSGTSDEPVTTTTGDSEPSSTLDAVTREARQRLKDLATHARAFSFAVQGPDTGGVHTRGSDLPGLFGAKAELPPPASAEVPVGQSGSLDINWPDDAPRFFLEQQSPDTYRKVELAEKEGYSVSAAPKPSGANYLVDLGMTKRALVGGQYDEQIDAYVGQPTVVKTVCTVGVPVVPGNMTIVTWRLPGGGLGGSAPTFTQWGLTPRYGGPDLPLTVFGRPSGVIATGLRVTLQLAGDKPVAAGERGPQSSAIVVSEPPTVRVSGGTPSAPAQVVIGTKVYELRIGGEGWRELAGAGDPVTVIAKLAEEGKVRIISEPVVLTTDGHPATVTISVQASGSGSEAGTDVETSADLGQSLTFTPRIGPNGELTLAVECSLDRLAAMLIGSEGVQGCVPLIMKLRVNAVAGTKDGQAILLRGLTSLKQKFDAKGITVAGDPVETIIVVTPRIVTEGQTQ